MVQAPTLDQLSPVLVANRGEIAERVIDSLHELGLRSVVPFTEPDEGAPASLTADVAVRVSSYLDGGAVLEAAGRSGARSVHPGYGFLSENAAFAREVEAAGLTWVGPPPEAIEVMGDKGRSKELAREAGVPVVPGTEGQDASLEDITAFASKHGFPILIKALSGGGGKGMRVVAAETELEGALGGARREAEAAFGDGRVLAERYLERPRHIEIQVLADSHGNTIHLGERECSLQRRHQKVIEEAPSPAIDPAMREAMGAAAVGLSEACGYRGAGTVEFIVPAAGGEFFFLEMNTRLQVEHPVTELVWGVDLVEQQLRVAAGEQLSLKQGELAPRGHAVESRLYAEDPASGFLPSIGTIRRWREPAATGVRVDAGVVEGSVIGTDYDPMLAKVIAHGPDRGTAILRLDRALGELELLGVATNAAFSRQLLQLDDVVAGRLDTGLLERALEDLDLQPPSDLGVAGAIAFFLADTAELTVAPGPWRRRFEGLGEIVVRDGVLTSNAGSWKVAGRDLGDGRLTVELDGISRTYFYAADAEAGAVWVARDGHHLEARIERRAVGAAAAAGSLEAPMPGKVLMIEATNGDLVAEGEVLMILESMKMELQITAPAAGRVEALDLAVGDQVAQGQTLLAVSAGDEGPDE